MLIIDNEKHFLGIIVFIFFCSIISHGNAFEYHWEIDETPEGQESSTIIQPVQVLILDEPIEIADNSASVRLMQKYSVHLGSEWDASYAYKLFQTFESIPQRTYLRGSEDNPSSIFILTDQHIHNDIDIVWHGDARIVTISTAAFVNTAPRLAEIEGVRGKFFSKRLHRAIVRFVTDNGTDRSAIRNILDKRYGVSISVPSYSELTRHTTGEDAGRFSEFKSEERIALISMLEEYPSGMLKTPGLKYIVRRLDGTSHPLYPTAPAIAWTSAGYIEFMESAFLEQDLDYIHRLILHEKAHFLWDHFFDDQLKQDWIELGGWYENPDDVDGWSTTKQTEFVSAYAHGKNPNEDMAESISFYIVRPDKLRSRSPAKYEFIQNRIMHGTRYISQIREDLTFKVYNLYPDYVYPGKIKGIDIRVEGAPEEDKLITVQVLVHRESDLDGVSTAYIRVFSEKGTYFDFSWLRTEERVADGQILRGQATLSKYAASGYWSPDTIRLWDANRNERLESQSDFGWKLYIDNPLSDCDPPQYVPNSMKLTLSDATTSEGQPYQIVTARWQVIEHSGLGNIRGYLNDTFAETYSKYGHTRYTNENPGTVSVKIKIADYLPGGVYALNRIHMTDVAQNVISVYFTDSVNDEPPQTIEIKTNNPDFEPPVLGINNINITAEPTNPSNPNGETRVNITFNVKDNISGYTLGSLRLRDPQGVSHHFYHYPEGRGTLYFAGDPTISKEYKQHILLPVGSVPGIWGLSHMAIKDKAGNWNRYDFTEIVRFEIDEMSNSINKSDVNGDGKINILDLVSVAQVIGEHDTKTDVNSDGKVNILDLVTIANQISSE